MSSTATSNARVALSEKPKTDADRVLLHTAACSDLKSFDFEERNVPRGGYAYTSALFNESDNDGDESGSSTAVDVPGVEGSEDAAVDGVNKNESKLFSGTGGGGDGSNKSVVGIAGDDRRDDASGRSEDASLSSRTISEFADESEHKASPKST